jgi:ABC-type multidrug transport system fused ATPase/permease subunit
MVRGGGGMEWRERLRCHFRSWTYHGPMIHRFLPPLGTPPSPHHPLSVFPPRTESALFFSLRVQNNRSRAHSHLWSIVAHDDRTILMGFDHIRDVSIDIPKGALVLVVGRVGSGKSSLLAAMAGEMNSRWVMYPSCSFHLWTD